MSDDVARITFRAGRAFRSHVPVHPHGTDPSRNDTGLNQPAPMRSTATGTWVQRNVGRGQYGRMAGAIAPATATIAVVAANIEAGQHRIEIGPYVLRPFLDFEVITNGLGPTGNNNDDTANLLAGAISALPGFAATARLDASGILDIERSVGVADTVDLRAVETSAVSAFTMSGTTMTAGTPAVSPPLFG